MRFKYVFVLLFGKKNRLLRIRVYKAKSLRFRFSHTYRKHIACQVMSTPFLEKKNGRLSGNDMKLI